MEQYKTVYPQTFEIIGINGVDNIPKEFKVEGSKKFARMLVQPFIKEEDRNYEVIDEDDKVIYRVPEWLIPRK